MNADAEAARLFCLRALRGVRRWRQLLVSHGLVRADGLLCLLSVWLSTIVDYVLVRRICMCLFRVAVRFAKLLRSAPFIPPLPPPQSKGV